jgi:THAP domain
MDQIDHNYCKIQKKSRTMCCVSYCNNRRGQIIDKIKISVYNFPKKSANAKRHREWVKLLRIGKEVPKNAVVCCQHFKEDDWIPPSSKNLAKM